MLQTLLVLFVAFILIGIYLRKRFTADTVHDEVHYAVTDDGVRIALFRYLPEKPDSKMLPVVCCHGYSETRFCFEIPGRSLPRYLNGKGHEVWTVELRGQGASRFKTDGSGIDWNFSMDDHAFRDLPAIVDKVREVTGCEKVNWVGHSMGGMILYAHLSKTGGHDGLHRAVTLGSPGTFRKGWKMVTHLVKVEPLMRVLPRLPLGPLNTLGLPLSQLGLLRLKFIANPENLKGNGFMSYLVNGLDSVSMGLSAQFAHFVRDNSFSGLDGYSYEENLDKVKLPVLVIAGGKDRLVPPKEIEFVHEQLGSKDKKLVTLSTRNGQKVSYGHGDLTIGDNAPEEVWPQIADWLAK